MSLEGLTGAYKLVPLVVSPTQLLLDPTNPRLITETSQFRSYQVETICSPATQAKILELVCRKEHGVRELIASIRELGFISGHQDMIVKQLNRDQ